MHDVTEIKPVNLKEHNIGGSVQARFDSLIEIFRKNFDDELEPAGASFSIYHKDQCIVNLYGGYRDVQKKLPWVEETVSVIFSTTKSISSVILAYVLDKSKSKITYNTKISEIWPEFGQHDKQNVTILDASLHRAGLAYVDGTVITRDDVKCPKKIAKYFENATRMTVAGQVVYHALTFGLLLDQIVRRIDDKQRGIAQILDEDFVKPFGIENLSIGLKTPEDNNKAATLTKLGEKEIMEQGDRNGTALALFLASGNFHNKILYTVFPWITVGDYNNLENRLLQMPSNMGIANSKGLAHFHSLVANKTILSEKFYELFKKPVLENEFDYAIGYTESKGYGFHYSKNPKGQWNFGHSGYGGQNVMVDTHNNLTFAYVSNGLKIEDAELVTTWNRLVQEAYRIFYKI